VAIRLNRPRTELTFPLCCFYQISQIPSDLVVRYQAIDIVGIILSFIW
jgi:hypothetical protein